MAENDILVVLFYQMGLQPPKASKSVNANIINTNIFVMIL